MKPKDKEIIRERINEIFSENCDEAVDRLLTRLIGNQRENDEKTIETSRQCL